MTNRTLRHTGILCAVIISILAGTAFGARDYDYPRQIRDLETKPTLSDSELVQLGKLHQQMGEVCDIAAAVAAKTLLDLANCVGFEKERWGAEYFSALASLELSRPQSALDSAKAGIQRRSGPKQLLTLMSVLRAVAGCKVREASVSFRETGPSSLFDSLEAASQVFLSIGTFPLRAEDVSRAVKHQSTSVSGMPLVERARLSLSVSGKRLDETAAFVRRLELRDGVPAWVIKTQCCEMQFCDPALYRTMARAHYALAWKSLEAAMEKSLPPKTKSEVAVYMARTSLAGGDTVRLSRAIMSAAGEDGGLQPFRGWLTLARGDQSAARAIWSSVIAQPSTPRALLDLFCILSRFPSQDHFADSAGRAMLAGVVAGESRIRLLMSRAGRSRLRYTAWALAVWQLSRGQFANAVENLENARAAEPTVGSVSLDDFPPDFCFSYSGALHCSAREDDRRGGFGGLLSLEPTFPLLTPLIQSSRLWAACASRNMIIQSER